MSELETKFRDKYDSNGVFSTCLDELSALVDEDGKEEFFKTLDIVDSFSKDTVPWMLKSLPSLLARQADSKSRLETLKAITSIGRAKWSAVVAVLNNLDKVCNTTDGFNIEWLNHGVKISCADQDAAIEYFNVSADVMEHLGGKLFAVWASLGEEIATKSWRASKEYFKASPSVLSKIEPGDMEQWARLGISLIEKSPKVKSKHKAQSLFAIGAAAGQAKQMKLGINYFKSAPEILGRVSISDLSGWVEEGLSHTDEKKEKGEAFFSLQTSKSRSAVDELVKGLELNDVHGVLLPFAEAFTGSKTPIRSSSIFYKNMPGLSRFFSVTDGTRIYLPPQVSIFADEELNFKSYKLSLIHEIAHLRYNTFDIGTKEMSALSGSHDSALSMKIFEFLEDERVDHLTVQELPVIARDKTILTNEFTKKLKPDELSMFEYLSYGIDPQDKAFERIDRKLFEALKKAMEKVKCDNTSVMHTLELAKSISKEIEAGNHLVRKTEERPFYRGVIDFGLIEKTKRATEELIETFSNRLAQKGAEVEAADILEAITRIEESRGIDSDSVLVHLSDSEEISYLFEETEQMLEEMESEKNMRRTVHYDEWDHMLDDYKKSWCRVREIDMVPTNQVCYDAALKEYYGVVSQLKRHFALLRPDRIKRFFREERGDDIDFDAVIESVVERHAGVTPSDRVYIRREKNLRDVSVAFLVDMSYSTSDELPNGKTIMDIQREGLVLMAEALESIGDQWAVYGFTTHYRDRCDVFVVRDFNMPFTDEIKKRFDGLKPTGQTRLGAVIRHASSLLARVTSRIRLLVLLSDGRPYDLDYGNAKYAIEDTRKAVWEGQQKGLSFYCITVDKKSRDYLPYMYGGTNFSLIDNVEALPVMLPLIYKRLTT